MKSSEYSVKTENCYINAKFVKALAMQLGITQETISLDLGWSKTTLNKYCTFESLISKKKRTELANYFHCAESKLIDYFPTTEIIEKHRKYADNKSSHWNEVRSQNRNIEKNKTDYSTQLLLEKISSLEKSIKLLSNNQQQFMNFFKAQFKQQDERSNKQQLYILNQLKKES